jgi:DnaJ-like protein
MGLIEKGSWLASAGKRATRFHGRIAGQPKNCAYPGCHEPGEFRVPPGEGRRADSNGPGDWRWMCLDHVRAFNTSYNYFNGMSPEEIEAAQTPYGGWERQTRAFAASGGDLPPRWADFTDPLDAIGARFARVAGNQPRADGRELSPADRKSLKVLGLGVDADRRALRQRYLDLVRRYHPDKNGGDRSHEKALQAVIEAYTQLRSRPAFA